MRGWLHAIAGALASWGPPGVLLLAALDSGGIPIPVGVDALLMVVAARSGPAGLLSAVLATAGSLAGCLFLFQLGRKGGEAYVDRRVHGHCRAARFHRWYERYGLLTVFVPALTPAPLPTKVFVLLAGAMNAPRGAFALTIVSARALRYFSLAWLGSRLGAGPSQLLPRHGWTLAIAALALFMLLALIIKFAAGRRPGVTIAGADHARGKPS